MDLEGKETIRIRDLSIGYGPEHLVAEGLNGEIMGGELTCLMGANGVGKSTLLKTLSAFLPKQGGDIFICGKQIGNYKDKELAKTIGMVLTERPEVSNMSVWDLVGLGRSPYTGFWGTLNNDDKKIVGEALSLVGIGHLSQRMADGISDGERQKVMIAKALAQQTPIIFLDEPTAFLDFPSKVDILLLLKKLARNGGKTIFLSTHDVSLALQVADKIWLMMEGNEEGTGEPGRSLSIGTPAELAENGILSRFIERDNISFDASDLSIQIRC